MSTVSTILAKKGSAVSSVSEDELVLNAARIMRDKHIGSVVVVRGETVVGIFTERDMLYRIVAESRDPGTTRVGEVMTAPVTTIEPAAELNQCAHLMTNRRMRHIPVVEGGKLAGIITAGDIMAHRVKHLEETNVFLQEYLQVQA
ncbi:MAG TPA: CBS domain-containing protein [Planctomycetota bacterium]|nr:CBS domain-containing protein [Planctomycetota bacterium]